MIGPLGTRFEKSSVAAEVLFCEPEGWPVLERRWPTTVGVLQVLLCRGENRRGRERREALVLIVDFFAYDAIGISGQIAHAVDGVGRKETLGDGEALRGFDDIRHGNPFALPPAQRVRLLWRDC